MLKIQVLGRGLIPRGHGLAPKKNPFPADLLLIGTILSTAGLSANFIHPETNKAIPLTRENYQQMYKKYDNAHLKSKAVKEEPEDENDEKVDTEKDVKDLEDNARNALVDKVNQTPPVLETDLSNKPQGSNDASTIVPLSTTVDTAPVQTQVASTPETPAVEKKDEVTADKKEEEFVVKPIIKQEEGPKVEVKVGNTNNYNKNQNNNFGKR